jgi:hypothetical protein
MAGRGRTPKKPEERRRRNVDPPARGEWTPADGVGWLHGPIPEPMASSRSRSWRGRRGTGGGSLRTWSPEDLPALEVLVRLYDQVERGKFQLADELRHWMDGYDLTPKGRQDRRWAPPVKDAQRDTPKKALKTSRYAHLTVVDS